MVHLHHFSKSIRSDWSQVGTRLEGFPPSKPIAKALGRISPPGMIPRLAHTCERFSMASLLLPAPSQTRNRRRARRCHGQTRQKRNPPAPCGPPGCEVVPLLQKRQTGEKYGPQGPQGKTGWDKTGAKPRALENSRNACKTGHAHSRKLTKRRIRGHGEVGGPTFDPCLRPIPSPYLSPREKRRKKVYSSCRLSSSTRRDTERTDSRSKPPQNACKTDARKVRQRTSLLG